VLLTALPNVLQECSLHVIQLLLLLGVYLLPAAILIDGLQMHTSPEYT
jgi:hypothetical protein